MTMRFLLARAAAFSLVLVVLTGASVAREIVLPPPTDGMESEAAARPREHDFKATHVNRCRGADGVVVLQDTPCLPVAPASATTANAVNEVTELSALQPRPVASVAAARDSLPSRSLTSGMLDGAWKLGLLVLAGYLILRGAGSARAFLRQRRRHDGARSP